MLDINEARKILGVSEDASRNEIERRYTIILKKHRINAAEGIEAEAIDIDQITMAYNVLMGYVEPPSEEELRAPNPLAQKIGIDEKKARNFFYYYKVHMIIGMIALLVIAFTVKGCVTKVNPDFNLAFVGMIGFNDTEKLKEAIKAGVPEIKEPGFDGAFIVTPKQSDGTQSTDTTGGNQKPTGMQTDGQQEYAMQMKAMILFSAADVDLFILDKANYAKYAEQGAFISLDEIAASLGINSEHSKPFLVKNAEDKVEHIYGIDVTNSKVLKDTGIIGEDMVTAIPVRAKNLEKAKKVMELLIK